MRHIFRVSEQQSFAFAEYKRAVRVPYTLINNSIAKVKAHKNAKFTERGIHY